jgi:hypothetical protein
MKDYQEKLPSIVTPKELDTSGIKVVDDEGREIIRPDAIQAVTQLASLAQLARIRKSLEKEEYRGVQDSRTLNSTDAYQVEDLTREYPFTPWATASFFNDGPDTVYIGINRRGSPAIVAAGESYQVDFTKADRRIELIYYWCDATETASVRVIGKY